MASTFSPNLNLELQATGENSGTWGALLNTTALSIIDDVLGNVQTLSLTTGNTAVSTSQTQNNFIKLTGALVGNCTVSFPAIGRTFIVQNSTSGAFSVTLRIGVSTGVVIPQGTIGVYVLDSTEVRLAASSAATFVYAAAVGTNTVTATFEPALTAYATGTVLYAVKIAATNTGAVTFNFNGLGAKAGKTATGADLIAGQLRIGMMALLLYDGTNMQVLNPAPVHYRYIGTQQFTSSGTYTPTSGCAYIEVEGVAAGGGGGFAGTNASDVMAAAGGAGSGASGFFSSAAPAVTAVTIGTGGTAGTSGAVDGGTGGTTSFGSSLVLAGGSGGLSLSASGTFAISRPGAGGAASAGTRTSAGTAGGNGSVADGPSATANITSGGAGAPSPFGGGGRGGFSASSDSASPTAGSGYGSGGGGGAARNSGGSQAGAAGAPGLIIVREYALVA